MNKILSPKHASLAAMLGLFLAAAACTGTANATGLNAKIGTLGAGFDISMPLSDRTTARIGFNQFTHGTTLDEGGISYTADLELNSAGVYFDWHPFGGAFRLTGGYLDNNNEISGRATGNVTVGTTNYGNVDLRGSIGFDSGTYVGIGWGNSGGKGLRFAADIGLLHQGSPRVALADATGTVSNSDLREEEAELEASLDDLDVYPVISFGVSYAF